MGQTDTQTVLRYCGSTSDCQLCGGRLELVGGTDPEKADDGFTETYECRICEATGTMHYEPTTNTESYTGACGGSGI